MTSRDNQRRGNVIVFATQKGGVGKTTNCVHIAAALGEIGRKCLIWDLDSNQGATLHMGLDGDRLQGTFEILSTGSDPLGAVITEDDAILPSNVHVIPAGSDVELVGRLSPESQVTRQLIAAVATLRDRYDYILLDTAPNLTIPTIAAYRTADWFILSAMPNPFAILGLKATLKYLKFAADRGTIEGRLLGVLLCCLERPRLLARLRNRRVAFDRQLTNYIDQRLTTDTGTSLKFKTMISSEIAISQHQAEGRTLLQVQPRHPVAMQYRSLVNEIEDRINGIQDGAAIIGNSEGV